MTWVLSALLGDAVLERFLQEWRWCLHAHKRRERAAQLNDDTMKRQSFIIGETYGEINGPNIHRPDVGLQFMISVLAARSWILDYLWVLETIDVDRGRRASGDDGATDRFSVDVD